ncbi:serine hydrolase domain-containing protein [Streptomyces sp. NPDC097619]|uniref:serine hydrolase domain-containing protein n=1 Tax=Streptomyces sp. NPDC097619 TaxID=3157228 RepID=UPI00332A4AD8
MTARRVADRLRELAREHSVPGAQLAVHGPEGGLSVAAGVVRSGSADPVTLETAFAYGSVTKAFTAALVARLVADGDVEFDDPVGDYLAEFEGAVDARMASVTVRSLLSHTSGLVADHEPEDSETMDPARYAASAARTGILYEPGTAFSYSNTGYVLLGRMVEAVTDMTWQQAMEKLVLKPLGIVPCFTARPGGRPRGPARTLADCHVVRPGVAGADPVGLFLPPAWSPAAGLAGSAEDLLSFARSHLGAEDGSVLFPDPAVRAALWERVAAAAPFGMADGWGLGLGVYSSPAGDWLGHDGTVDGGTAHLRFHPESGTAVALTTNATTGTRMWARLVDELRGAGVPVGDSRPLVPPLLTWDDTGAAGVAGAAGGATASLDVLGDYRNGDTSFSVRRTANAGPGALEFTDGTGLRAALTLHEGLVFTARRTDADEAPYLGRFVTDGSTGRIAALQLAGRSALRVPVQ